MSIPAAEDPGHGRRYLWLAVLVTFLVYLPSIGAGFVVDDLFLASSERMPGVRNEMVAKLHPIGEYFGAHYWKGTLVGDPLYRPVTIYSFALTNAVLAPVFGEAKAQHLVNLALHLAAVACVFFLLRRLKVSSLATLVGTLVFGLHALRHEAVVMVVGRAEILALTFVLVMVLTFFRLREATVTWQRGLYGSLACGALFLAICSKESALAGVPFLLLVEAVRSLPGRGRAGAECSRILFSGTAVVAPALLLWWWLRSGVLGALPDLGTIAYLSNPLAFVGGDVRLYTATVVWSWSLLQVLLPLRLMHDYGPNTFTLVTDPLSPSYLAAGTLLLVCLFGGLLLARSRPMLLLAVATFLGFGFLVSNIPFAIGTIYGERLSYAPALGLTFAVAWLVQVTPVRRRRLLLGGVFLWLAWSVILLLQRHGDYTDEAALVRADMAKNPHSLRMQIQLAQREADAGDHRSALARLQHVVQVEPELALAWNALGARYLSAGELEGAETSFRRGLGARYLQRREDGFWLHGNLGHVLKLNGRLAEAFDSLQRSVALEPTHVPAIVDLLDVSFRGDQPDDTIEQLLAKGEAAAAGAAEWSYYRGLLARRRGDLGLAEQELRQALIRTAPHRGALLSVVDALAQVMVARGKKDEILEMVDRMRVDTRFPASTRQALLSIAGRLR